MEQLSTKVDEALSLESQLLSSRGGHSHLNTSLGWPWQVVTTGWIPERNSSPSSCDWQKNLQHTLEITVLTTAATIVLLLNLIQPRSKQRCKPSNLWSLLDVVCPVKFIGGNPLRYMYCVIMSCWGADVVQDLLDTSLYYRSSNGLLDALTVFVNSPTVIILKEALAYFPVLACVDAPVRVVGYIVGFFYTILLGVYKVDIEAIFVMGCSYYGQQTNEKIGVSLAVHLPIYIAYLVVIIWFFCHSVTEVALLLFTRTSLQTHAPSHSEYSTYVRHVKQLFKRPDTVKKHRRARKTNTVWSYLVQGFKYVMPYQSSFIYPLPFLAGMCMSWTIIYQLAVYIMYKENFYVKKLIDFINGFNITVVTIKDIFPSVSRQVDNFFYDAQSFAEAYLIILPFSSSIAFGLCMFFTMYMTQSFHKHLRNAYKGDIGPLVKSEPLPSPPYRLASTMRFTAFLISHLLFSWLLYSVMLVGLFTIGLVFYYLFKDTQNYGIHVWSFFMIPMMWSTFMHHLQIFLCRNVFNDKSGGKDMIKIRFRHLYNLLAYIFFFFNVIFGFVMCFLRVFGVLIFTCVMLFRMDWDVYMRGLEGWDMGNRTYIGYLYTEVTLNNAVVRVFLKLLQDSVNKKRLPLSPTRRPEAHLQFDHHHQSERRREPATVAGDDERVPLLNGSMLLDAGSEDYAVSSKPHLSSSSLARRRWLVAYTLLRNPSVQELTASRLCHEGTECQPAGEGELNRINGVHT